MPEKSIKGFCLWLFWTVFYSVRPRERDFDRRFNRIRHFDRRFNQIRRTCWPWKKFK